MSAASTDSASRCSPTQYSPPQHLPRDPMDNRLVRCVIGQVPFHSSRKMKLTVHALPQPNFQVAE